MGLPVSLGVEMRRFKCLNRQCSQATFAEQIDVLALPKQRRTIGLDEAWRSIAQALGGSAASRLSATLGMPTSRDTLLRGLRRLGRNVTPATPVVVGIDDWAITRGHRYGTIVVDLERRCPIEVLDGRESTSVADWLQRHPSIMLVARDRAGAYSDAVQSVIPWGDRPFRANWCAFAPNPLLARLPSHRVGLQKQDPEQFPGVGTLSHRNFRGVGRVHLCLPVCWSGQPAQATIRLRPESVLPDQHR
jgi:hypothetical protein